MGEGDSGVRSKTESRPVCDDIDGDLERMIERVRDEGDVEIDEDRSVEDERDDDRDDELDRERPTEAREETTDSTSDSPNETCIIRSVGLVTDSSRRYRQTISNAKPRKHKRIVMIHSMPLQSPIIMQ